jgi:hypothetical protein
MSGITLVFGENPEAGVPTGQGDAVELEEDSSTKKWPLEESMYVRVFKGTIFQPTVSCCRMACWSCHLSQTLA